MASAPLAERMRPRTLDEYVGQGHLVGPQGVIRLMLQTGSPSPLILWGPPGVGKTTLAQIVAQTLERPFFTLSAVHSGVKDIRAVLERAQKSRLLGGGAPLLFIDEIHRFSKSQQDSLLGAVEKGEVVLVGATTENPSFEVISALLSRCQVYTLRPLERTDLEQLVARAISRDELLRRVRFDLRETEALYGYAAGDARRLLNILELLYNARTGDSVEVSNALVENLLQRQTARYDRDGEMHYDCISAFIKSVRGSDPNGALYWLARMLEGGEDPVFIARRLIILAAEDIGLANPNALLIANATMQSVQSIGMPEGRIVLSEATTYLACSPKSNSTYLAIDQALDQVRSDPPRAVPLHLRNAPTRLMRQMGYGENYSYAHDFPNHFVAQEFLPEGLEGRVFYNPADNPRENDIRSSLRANWKDKYDY
ncbi:MAG: AAA family ATPase [Bacteroidia bacterium]|nr:MAG: AAA family ATPase [Bacteroidia bacterium]